MTQQPGCHKSMKQLRTELHIFEMELHILMLRST